VAHRRDDSGTLQIRGSGRYWSWFLLIASIMVVALLLWIRADRSRQLADWQARLESVVDDRNRMIELWLDERAGDGHLWAVFPSVRELAAERAALIVPPKLMDSTHLAGVLTSAAASHGYSAIHLLDLRGEAQLTSAGAQPLAEACRVPFRQAMEARHQTVSFHLHGSEPRIAIVTPVEDDAGQQVGAIYAVLDPRQSFYPLLDHEPVPTDSGETFLIHRTPGGTVLLSPRRKAAGGGVLQPLPPGAARFGADLALAHESFGVFHDERGERVLAATRSIATTNWLLVALVDESEALTSHRNLVSIVAVALAAALAVLFIAFAYIRSAAVARAEAAERLAQERHRAAEERAALRLAHERAGELRVLETIAAGAPLATALGALVRYVEEQQPGLLASVLLVDKGTLRHAVAPSLPESYCAAIDGIAVAEGRGSCGTAAFRGTSVLVSDIATDPLWEGLTDLAREHRLAACWSHPIRLADGTVCGTFALYRREPGSPDEREVALVERATHIAAIAIDRHRVAGHLESSLAELSAIFDSTAVGMTLIDPAGLVVKANPAMEAFLGFAVEELRGRHFGEFFHPDDRAAGFPLYTQLMSGTLDSYQTEKRFLHKDGKVLWGRVTVSLVKSGEPSEGFAIGLVEDFTDRRQLQTEMQQAGKMEAVGRLAGGIAHDFNNILNVILGCGELALTELQHAPETRRLVEEILAGADRAALLTRQLLAFSRKQNLETRVLDPSVVVQEMAQLLRRVLGEDIEIVVSSLPGTAHVRADRGQLEQVLMNLTVNSRDAMPAGGRLTIETAAVELDEAFAAQHPGSRPGPHVRLSVTDTGRGMTPEVLARVFEPFFTTKEASKGTGLGLATVYGIVKQSNGYITVDSAPDRGTRFDIYLPQVDEPVAAAPVAAPPLVRGHESILVVEDEPSLRKLLQTMLATMGYDVRVAQSAPAAVEMCAADPATTPVDLLLTDIVMPEMNGREVARRVRELRPKVKVLYMSGYTGDVLLQHGELEDDASMIAKPFSRDALASKVREALS